MIAIFPNLTRSVVVFDFSEYKLPKRYLVSDMKKAIDSIPEMAYENNFPLNLENLFSSLVVFLLPSTHTTDTKILQSHPQNYEVCVDYDRKLTDVLVQKYTYQYSQGRMFWFDTEKFNDFALVMSEKALSNMDFDSDSKLKNTHLFLQMCSLITLKKPHKNYKNTKDAIRIATIHILLLLTAFDIDVEKVDPNLLKYLQEHATNRKTVAALVGMVVALGNPTLEQFLQKYGVGGSVISEYDSNIGSLLFHLQRSDSFFQLSIEKAFKVGLLRYSESTQETTLALFQMLDQKIDIKTLPSLLVELMVTTTEDNHNTVRYFLVDKGILPRHTKIDVNNLIRLDSKLVENLKENDQILAVALGLDARVESMTMH